MVPPALKKVIHVLLKGDFHVLKDDAHEPRQHVRPKHDCLRPPAEEVGDNKLVEHTGQVCDWVVLLRGVKAAVLGVALVRESFP